MNTLLDLFNVGMMRSYSDIKTMPKGLVLNLGAGKKLIEGSFPLDYPEWDAEIDVIPFEDNSVDGIHCYHMLEHIDGKRIPFAINEMQRVLKVGGVVNIVVPHGMSHMQMSELDHRTFFTEKSFKKLFSTEYFTKNKIKPMQINMNLIMADEYNNLALIVQLEKTE